MTRFFSILYGSLFLIFVAGCTSLSPDDEFELDKSFFDDAAQVEFSTVHKSASVAKSVVEKENAVFRDEESFQKFWRDLFVSEHNPDPDVPEINFSEYTVIASLMGNQRSGGFSLTITEIAVSEDVTGVRIKEIEPGANCGVTAAITQPFHVVKIPKSADGDIRFLTQREVRDCED